MKLLQDGGLVRSLRNFAFESEVLYNINDVIKNDSAEGSQYTLIRLLCRNVKNENRDNRRKSDVARCQSLILFSHTKDEFVRPMSRYDGK